MSEQGAASTAKTTPLTERERDVVQRLSQGFGWPTVLLTVGLIAAGAGVIVWWAVGGLPLMVGMLLNAWVSYALYTVHHDATHRSISGRIPSRQAWDTTWGTIAGLVIGIEFQSYAKHHLRHHAHTNTAKDPDLNVKGSFGQLPMKWMIGNVLTVVGALPGGVHVNRRLLRMIGMEPPARMAANRKAELARQRRLTRAHLLIIAASVPLGLVVPVLFLWWLPTRLGLFLLMVLFQWLPHFPFDRTDRFGATRITLFPGSTWLLLQQDRHLIHHLYPSIPWYRYRAAYRELLPLLREREAIIAGPGTEPRVPIRLR